MSGGVFAWPAWLRIVASAFFHASSTFSLGQPHSQETPPT